MAGMLTAISKMTFDQLTNCFPQVWQFALATLRAQKERELRQEKAKEEARIEAAKPINRLKQSYFNYMVVKRCYDVRLGYAVVWINEIEMERARRAVSAIETSIFKEDSSIDKNDAWQEAAKVIRVSTQPVEQYFCQRAYNELLNAEPYSPPVKDFGADNH